MRSTAVVPQQYLHTVSAGDVPVRQLHPARFRVSAAPEAAQLLCWRPGSFNLVHPADPAFSVWQHRLAGGYSSCALPVPGSDRSTSLAWVGQHSESPWFGGQRASRLLRLAPALRDARTHRAPSRDRRHRACAGRRRAASPRTRARARMQTAPRRASVHRVHSMCMQDFSACRGREQRIARITGSARTLARGRPCSALAPSLGRDGHSS